MDLHQIIVLAVCGLFCVGIGWLIGVRHTNKKLAWGGRLSVIFSDGDNITTTMGDKDDRFVVELNAEIMKIVLKNATRRILPPFIIYDHTGRRLPYSMDYFGDGSIEINFASRITATPGCPVSLFMQFTCETGTYRYLQVDLATPRAK